jgi:raffinose/stachyose/melibiose transport system substrate-binding protein
MTSDEMVSKFALTSATALKDGAKVDEKELSGLGKAGLEMVNNITGISDAVQDQIPTECRVPIFDGMPNIVTGKVKIPDAVTEVLTMIEDYQPEDAKK